MDLQFTTNSNTKLQITNDQTNLCEQLLPYLKRNSYLGYDHQHLIQCQLKCVHLLTGKRAHQHQIGIATMIKDKIVHHFKVTNQKDHLREDTIYRVSTQTLAQI